MKLKWRSDITRARAGFTLIDLLVTMAVIAILIAIIAPVTIQSRNRAKMVSCVSNLQQLGRAALLYGQDWGDRLPKLAGSPFAGQGPIGEWPDGTSATRARMAISRYASSDRVFMCSGGRSAPAFGFAIDDDPVFQRTGSSYVPWPTARAGKYGAKLNGERIPSEGASRAAVLFMDYGSDWHGRLERRGVSVETVSQVNTVFADGHSKTTAALGVTTDSGEYTWLTASRSSGSGSLRMDGSLGTDNVELTGGYASVGGQGGYRLRLSGIVMVGDMAYEVDREFAFGPNTDLNAAMRQVTFWVESLAGR